MPHLNNLSFPEYMFCPFVSAHHMLYTKTVFTMETELVPYFILQNNYMEGSGNATIK